MHPELLQPGQAATRGLRVDGTKPALAILATRSVAAPVLAVMAIGFVLVGAGNLDLGAVDARVGLAAREPLGPMGQVLGHWAPELWPGRVAVSRLASLFKEGTRVTPGSVLWPAALAVVAIGWLLANRTIRAVGTRAGLWFGLCWFGCLGAIDHSGETGLELISGLAIIGALDRLLTRGSDWTAGCWAASAFLAGGWPPLLLILLAVIVIGRRDVGFTPRLLLPPIAAFIACSIWAMSAASTEAWAAALTWPLTQRPDWWLTLVILALGLPFSPFAFLALSRSVRENWGGSRRYFLAGWFQVGLACLVAGTIIPGLAQASRVPALAGMLMTSAAGLDAAWNRILSRSARRLYFALIFGLLFFWLITMVYGGYRWTVVSPYYRPLGISVLLLGIPVLALGWSAIENLNTRRAMMALMLLAISLKIVHWGYHVPEFNYRHGQGPWGRAIGQWLLPNWTLYVFLDWPPDLAFAIGCPVRKLRSPEHLAYEAPSEGKHVLLLDSEFEHWPAHAPRIFKVAEFQDQDGGKRILARTEGRLVAPSGALISNEESQ